MRKIVAFNETEKEIVSNIKNTLQQKQLEHELNIVISNEMAIEDLVISISHYPAILVEQHLGHASRSINTLIDSLCKNEIFDLRFRKPTKAILGDGFAVAKTNFFYMLLYLSRETNDLKEYEHMILPVISHNVYSIMAEEVFLSILSDRTISMHIRTNAAYMLIDIWEFRLDIGVVEFAPLLEKLWEARFSMQPSYGTMIGISELFALSEKADPLCLEFLERDDLKKTEFEALQEFLMDLTYEEMVKLNKIMETENKTSLNKDEITTILEKKDEESIYHKSDPRNFYMSFNKRKKNAFYRFQSNAPGPKKTLEEYIMCYLLHKPEGS